MAKGKKKVAKKPKAPHCKILKDGNGATRKTAAGKTKKMCFGGDGKITSEANVKAYRKRMASKRAA